MILTQPASSPVQKRKKTATSPTQLSLLFPIFAKYFLSTLNSKAQYSKKLMIPIQPVSPNQLSLILHVWDEGRTNWGVDLKNCHQYWLVPPYILPPNCCQSHVLPYAMVMDIVVISAFHPQNWNQPKEMEGGQTQVLLWKVNLLSLMSLPRNYLFN